MGRKLKGPGWFGLLMEFFGMTWPDRARKAAAQARVRAAAAPRCTACGNPSKQIDGRWRCPHHPNAELEATEPTPAA